MGRCLFPRGFVRGLPTRFGHRVHSCCRSRGAYPDAGQDARPTANAILAQYLAGRSGDLGPDLYSHGRNFGLGSVLFLGGMPAQHGRSLLFFRRHLRHGWLRRSRFTGAVEAARTGRGLGGNSDVRPFDRALLCGGEQTLAGAEGKVRVIIEIVVSK